MSFTFDNKYFHKTRNKQKEELELFNSSDESMIVTTIESFSICDVTVSFSMGGNVSLDINKFPNNKSIRKGNIVCLKQQYDTSDFNVIYVGEKDDWVYTQLQDAYSKKRILTGKLMYTYKKENEVIGYFVNICGFRSLMYLNEMTELTQFDEGCSIKVIVDQINYPLKVIVSYDKAFKIQQQLEGIQVGQQFEGQITKVFPYGIWVKFGYLYGFVKKSETIYGYSRIMIENLFKEGDTIAVEVKSNVMNTDGSYYIELSHKSCIDNPWEKGQYNEGSICECKCIKINDDSILVEVEPDFYGIIPISEMTHELFENMKLLKIEDSEIFPAKIILKDSIDFRLVLSILQTNDNWDEDWLEISKNYQIGNIISAKIVSIEEDALWVKLEEDFEAKVPSNEFSWPKIIKEEDDFQIGDEINIVIIEINIEKKLIKASIRQCEPNPWILAEENINILENVHFRVLSELPNEYKIETLDNYHLLGDLPVSELSWTKSDDKLNLEKEYVGKVLSISAKRSLLKVSIKRMEKDPFESICIGKVFNGVIESTDNEKIVIKLENGVRGFSYETNLIESTNDSIPFKVIEFNRQEKIIRLSNKRIQHDLRTDEIVRSFFQQQKNKNYE
jgi:small subunit ribosomal protein S1